MNSAMEQAVALMIDFAAPWGIAGGWAVDLFIGHQSRPHADLDIAILRVDQQRLRARLSGRVEKVVEGQRADWAPEELLELPVHEARVTWSDGYSLEILLNEHDRATHEWVFRRDARIRLPLATAFATDRVAPYLAPEIVLLYKAKATSTKDDADFRVVLPYLRAEQRLWLREALDITVPGHRWASILEHR